MIYKLREVLKIKLDWIYVCGWMDSGWFFMYYRCIVVFSKWNILLLWWIVFGLFYVCLLCSDVG